MQPVNIFKLANPEGRIDVGPAAGSVALGMYVFDLAPGQSSCPYHYEYVEEWLLVVEGVVIARTPTGEQTLVRGDLVCFPAGAAGAHKIMNRSAAQARTLMFSAATRPAVTIYPDSDKIGVRTRDDEEIAVFRRGSAVPWSDGEEGWDRAT